MPRPPGTWTWLLLMTFVKPRLVTVLMPHLTYIRNPATFLPVPGLQDTLHSDETQFGAIKLSRLLSGHILCEGGLALRTVTGSLRAWVCGDPISLTELRHHHVGLVSSPKYSACGNAISSAYTSCNLHLWKDVNVDRRALIELQPHAGRKVD